jgi:predicted SprT family Zn-dependent metalloprotease
MCVSRHAIAPPVEFYRVEQGEALTALIQRAATSWGLSELGRYVTLRTSSRIRRSLGSFRPARNEIIVASWILEASDRLRAEVVCHEAAHAAVHFLHGEGVRPHGPEWRDLMTKAGFSPRVRIPASELPESRQTILAKSNVWEHRCPVCQATRLARTRVTRWRCGRCRAAGRSGELGIQRVAGPIAVDS